MAKLLLMTLPVCKSQLKVLEMNYSAFKARSSLLRYVITFSGHPPFYEVLGVHLCHHLPISNGQSTPFDDQSTAIQPTTTISMLVNC